MSPIGLAIEIGLAVLLLIAIFYCWRLDRRLTALRKGNDGMIQASKELAETIVQAEAAIDGMRRSSEVAGRELQRKIDEARRLSGPSGRARSHVGREY